MPIIEILQYPDPGLKRKGVQVTHLDDHIQNIIDDMFATHYHTEQCAALAATQLAIDNAPAITVIDYSQTDNKPLCLINPEIILAEGETNEPEACMSILPGEIAENIKRAAIITVKALNREGQTIEFSAEGHLAKCIQHELDHLNGILYLDHLSLLKRQRLQKRIFKLQKQEPKAQP